MTFTPRTPAEALQGIGLDLGRSDWIAIDQRRIDLFAEATGDHVWLHVDPERAAKGPFGGTIAHGFLTLSLLNMVLPDFLLPQNLDWGVNYGVNRVRFPAPVPVGSRLRVQGRLVGVEPAGARSIKTTVEMRVEIEGSDRLACVAEMVQHYTFLS